MASIAPPGLPRRLLAPKALKAHIVCGLGRKRLTQCQIAQRQIFRHCQPITKKQATHPGSPAALRVEYILREGDSGHCLSDSGFE